jgi:hypothetical protein
MVENLMARYQQLVDQVESLTLVYCCPALRTPTMASLTMPMLAARRSPAGVVLRGSRW